MFTLVDLFCGTGAFSVAFHNTGKFTTVFANDMLDSSAEIFNANNTSCSLTKQDIHELDVNTIPKSTIICGGFPCQCYSIAGGKKGFADKRSEVFWKLLDILKATEPPIVLLENVKNLTSHDNGNTFRIIITSLEQLGYYVKYKVLNTSVVTGIPQNRERIYIICFKNVHLYNTFEFDFPEVELQPVANFLETNVDAKYYYTPSTAIYKTLQETVVEHINTNTVYQYRRHYVRENKNNVCPTLTANMGTGGHNVPLILDDKGIRKLTPTECFRLQGFPSNYKLPSTLSNSKLYCLAGNAVTVSVVQLIADKLVSCGINMSSNVPL